MTLTRQFPGAPPRRAPHGPTSIRMAEPPEAFGAAKLQRRSLRACAVAVPLLVLFHTGVPVTAGKSAPSTPSDSTATAETERSARLVIHPVEIRSPDPHGLAGMLVKELQKQGSRRDQRVIVVLDGMNGTATDDVLRARHYELNVRILDLDEGEVGGIQLDPVVRAGRTRTEITAVAELVAPDSVVRREVIDGKGARRLGVYPVPESGSLESTVVPDEIRTRLRRQAIRDLAKRILDSAVATIVEEEDL